MKNCLRKFKINENGFTLAEVLITLVIIGVIAAMTIPTLINKTQNQEFVSRLKKSYSTLAQVTTQIVADRGAPINWVTSTDDIYNLYKSKLINVKDCGPDSGCFEQTIKYLNGSVFSSAWNTGSYHRRVIMGDGTQLLFGGASTDFSAECSLQKYGSNNVCQSIFVDVNGNKNPNTFGKDIFCFLLTENGLFPAGYEQETYCSKTSSGYDCAARVLRENAINY